MSNISAASASDPRKGRKTALIRTEVAVIGGGPAGLAAAIAARESGASVVVLEREAAAGGILNQCIHNGFGLHTFREELTGPEYAQRYIDKAAALNIPCLTDTTVLDITPDRVVTAVNPGGLIKVKAGAVVLAMGCRERPRGALNIPGARVAGVYTAGAAQKYVNAMGMLPGKRAVILGSGDIGLIMARRMVFEGAEVLCVAELMPHSSGLNRNIVQCLNDFNIPLLLSHTVTEIRSKDNRLSGVTVSRVDEKLKPIPGTGRDFDCDLLLLSVGLLPENELSRRAGVALSPITGGAEADNRLMTSVPGIFSCGNVLHVHDIVDFVSMEAERAGKAAARYALLGAPPESARVPVEAGQGVRYAVPKFINAADSAEKQVINFRVGAAIKSAEVTVTQGGKTLLTRKRLIVTPGEMERIELPAGAISGGEPVIISAAAAEVKQP